jgi:hypothetical protein
MHEELLDAALARVLTRLTILELPETAAAEVIDDLVTLLTFESGNSAPAIISNGAGGSLVWRGYITGGLATLYEQVAPLADRHGLSALIADERLEVHVAAGSEKVLVIGPLTDTMEVSRWLWEQRVERALEPDELAQWFVFDRIQEGAEQILQSAADGHEPVGPSGDERPATVDYAQVDGSTYNLMESYAPDGELQDAVVECRPIGGRWRTDFQAPYVERDAGPVRIVGWHVAQWQLVVGPDEWTLTARADAGLQTVLAHLPAPLRDWAIARTEAALALLDRLVPERRGDDDGARDRLRRELARLTM